MKKYILLLPVFFAVLFYKCTNSNTVFPPLTNEPTEMGKIVADDVFSTDGGTASKTDHLGSGQLNFVDRDSVVISFSYKGTSSNTSDFQLQVFDSTAGRGIVPVYTFKDPAVKDSLKFASVQLLSDKEFAYYFYTLKCAGEGSQSFSIRNLRLFKK